MTDEKKRSLTADQQSNEEADRKALERAENEGLADWGPEFRRSEN